ncbi:transmembrane protein 183 [Coccinella septempunctata]|uniref:transmembrane protein 183 n=1 Tax=Coccinella septempunctata TaxID=41139 RepID=UPI001D05DC33|nr:transmembrane protein 183 [Coccinella septempunctata]
MAKQVKVGKKIKGSKDVTIYDFANSPQTTNRPKKSEVSITNVVKNELEIKEHWYSDDEDEETDKKSPQCKKKGKPKNEKKDEETGVNYPVDIWFLISNHIRPEDVGRFAAICKASYAVVQSALFWKCLYKRYYNKECLTLDFQPECVLRHYGLRTAVIRALYLMYPPLVKRTRQALLGITHPDVLLGMTCVGVMSKTEGKNGIQFLCYYFKFKRNTAISFETNKTKEESLIDLLNDINANPEEDHCILLAISNEQICFPPILGQTLKHVSVSLSKGFCNNRLQLVFGNALDNFTTRGNLMNGNTIVLDPVSNISILNWWHPMYIKSNNIPSLDE